LAFVKGPESFSFEFESTGNVQAVEGADAELWPVAAAEFSAELECAFWHVARKPQSAFEVYLKYECDFVRVGGRHLSAKHLARERMCPLSENKRG
jgi:hypothetical protein